MVGEELHKLTRPARIFIVHIKARFQQQMLTELQTLAKSKDVTLPTSGSLKDQAQMKIMEKTAGADFDKKYMEQMVKDHQKDAKETQDIAAKAKDPEFKAAVQKAHAKIEEHLQLAQRVAQAHGAAAGGTSSTK